MRAARLVGRLFYYSKERELQLSKSFAEETNARAGSTIKALRALNVENDRTRMIAEVFWPRCTGVLITESYFLEDTNVQCFMHDRKWRYYTICFLD